MAEAQGSKDINRRKQRKKAAAQRKKQQQQEVLEKGSQESESNSESDSEDDLLAFASGGKVSNKVEKETDEHRYESESARATRLIKEEYRREQSMLKKKEKKNALRELTLSNLGAAWYSENDGDEENWRDGGLGTAALPPPLARHASGRCGYALQIRRW